MVRIYADTSVLVSLAMEDGNSGVATALVSGIDRPLVYTELLRLEVVNAIRLTVAVGKMNERNAMVSQNLAGELVASGKWQIAELDWPRVFSRARGLSVGHTKELKSRSLDILHVASAMELGLREFWSFDVRQKELARHVGLRVNP